MIDEFAKDHLHGRLRGVRASMLWKLEGLDDYDVRRPLTTTGTNLLGLIKHLANTEARYFGDVFDRPFAEQLTWFDDDGDHLAAMWATSGETRADIIDRYRRVWDHSDATITALDIDAPGHVPWWPSPDVTLFNILVHVVAETNRHAGHADILREQLDGTVGGTRAETTHMQRFDADFWAEQRAKIAQAAEAADPRHS